MSEKCKRRTYSAGDTLMQHDFAIKSHDEEDSLEVDAKGFKSLSLSSKTLESEDEENYDMSKPCVGLALIINNEHFQNNSSRRGTKVDAYNLIKTFTNLKFNVEEIYNADKQTIKDKIRYYSSVVDHSQYNCFALIILSHGDDDCFYATDGRVSIKKLVNRFRGDQCKTLLGKPKIFIIQACRGQLHETGLEPPVDVCDGLVCEQYGDKIIYTETSTVATIPAGADFILCYSVAEGFFSHRDTSNGSWYIQSLTQVIDELLKKKKEVNFLDVLTAVNQKVSKKSVLRSYNLNSLGKKQMPTFQSLLTKKLVFNQK